MPSGQALNRPGHARQHIQIRMREPGRARAGHPRLQPHRLTIAKALGQPGQHPFRREVEDGPEIRPQDIGLALGVVVDVAACQVPVQRQIPGCSGGLDAEARHQVLAADLADEAHAQLHECEPVALWLGERCKLLVRHRGWIGRARKMSTCHCVNYTGFVSS